MVNFKFECDGGEKRTILKSFELIIEDEIIEFSTNKQIDLINIRQILKSKMNFLGFHEQFRVIKKIGKGNFAIVYFFLSNSLNYLIF